MTARARLDADRTAEPLTRIEHHPPHGGCISPYMPLVNPEYVDENGKRTPLNARAEAPPSLAPSEVAFAKIVVTQRFSDYHAAIDGTAGRKWGCGKTIDEAVGALVRNHPEAFGAVVDIGKAGVL